MNIYNKYFDYQATTPVDSKVLEKMLPFFQHYFGNPSSLHITGLIANEAVENSRKNIAKLFGCKHSEVIFTSSASESNNLALKGIAQSSEKKKHIITTATEHKCILNTCKFLEKLGFTISFTSVNKYGEVDLKKLESLISKDTLMISVIHANNETGVINPIKDVSNIAKKYGVILHTDATQSLGYLNCNLKELGADLLTCSSHKIYGPKGVGALIINNNLLQGQISPLLHGGGQERNLRGGTLNVPGIIGFSKAIELAKNMAEVESSRLNNLRKYFLDRLKNLEINFVCNTPLTKSLPNCLSISFSETNSQALLQMLSDYALSTGSACNSDNQQSSHVLMAMGLDKKQADSTIRISFGRYTQKIDVENFILDLYKSINKITQHTRKQITQ